MLFRLRHAIDHVVFSLYLVQPSLLILLPLPFFLLFPLGLLLLLAPELEHCLRLLVLESALGKTDVSKPV